MRKLFILGILILFIPVVLFADFTDAQIEYAFAQKMQLDTIRILEADENNRVVIEELHFQDLLPTMNEYTRGYYADFNRQLSALRLVEVQRDRLNYLYERKQETLINSLMPNAISIATVTFSTRSLLSSVIAIAGTALSSINSYATQEDVIELEYIQQDWELDDQETLALDALATNLYLYKCDIGASLGIDRTQALSSDDLKSFVRACNESSPAVRYSRLSRLESRLGTLPDYWREMAKAAYELEQYEECLSFLEKYEAYYVPVFFHDNDHASAMMIKAYCILETEAPVDQLSKLVSIADEILKNTQDDDWVRYIFCAGLFEDMYMQSGDIDYAKKAYDCYLAVLYCKVKEFEANTLDYASLTYIKNGLNAIDEELSIATAELEYAKSEKGDNARWFWSSNKDYYKGNVNKAQTRVDELKSKREMFETTSYYELPPDDSFIIKIFSKITELATQLGLTDDIGYLSAYDMMDEAIYDVYSRNEVFGEAIPGYDCAIEYEHNTVFSDNMTVEIPLYQLQYIQFEDNEGASVYENLINSSNYLTLTINEEPFTLYPSCFIYNPGDGNVKNVLVILYADKIKSFDGGFADKDSIKSISLYINSSCFVPLNEYDNDINLWNIPRSLPAFKGITDNIKYDDSILGTVGGAIGSGIGFISGLF